MNTHYSKAREKAAIVAAHLVLELLRYPSRPNVDEAIRILEEVVSTSRPKALNR